MHSSVLLARITVTHLRDSCTTDNKPQVANSPMNEEATPCGSRAWQRAQSCCSWFDW